MEEASPPEVLGTGCRTEELWRPPARVDIVSQIPVQLRLGTECMDAVVLVQKSAPHKLHLGDTQPALGIALVVQELNLFTHKPKNLPRPRDAGPPEENSKGESLPNAGRITTLVQDSEKPTLQSQRPGGLPALVDTPREERPIAKYQGE